MFQTRTKNISGNISEFLTEEGINDPINRLIIHILQAEKNMYYSDLLVSMGLEHRKFAVHISKLISKNVINRDINNSRLSLNIPFIEEKGYKI